MKNVKKQMRECTPLTQLYKDNNIHYPYIIHNGFVGHAVVTMCLDVVAEIIDEEEKHRPKELTV